MTAQSEPRFSAWWIHSTYLVERLLRADQKRASYVGRHLSLNVVTTKFTVKFEKKKQKNEIKKNFFFFFFFLIRLDCSSSVPPHATPLLITTKNEFYLLRSNRCFFYKLYLHHFKVKTDQCHGTFLSLYLFSHISKFLVFT